MKLNNLFGGTVLASSALVVGLMIPLPSNADSTVTTSQGTFKCDNTCVVDDEGGVTDCCGGSVWKKMEDTFPEDEF
jgi:hypothetical protein